MSLLLALTGSSGAALVAPASSVVTAGADLSNCIYCSNVAANCNFQAVDYNPTGNVFVGLTTDFNLRYSNDGINWTTSCCCTCINVISPAAFFTASNGKTILYSNCKKVVFPAPLSPVKK